MKGEKIITLFLSVLVVLMIALVVIQNTVGLDAVFGKTDAGQAAGRPEQKRVANTANVEIKVMQPSTFIKTISINGELEIKDSSRQVPADTTGKITEILVERGDYVKAGQVVAKADPSTPGSVYKTREIKSTVSGTVLSVDSYIGENLSNNTAVLTVGNPGELILKLNVPEKYLASFGMGSEAEFTAAAYPDNKYKAFVSFIDNSVNTSTRTVAVELKIENADNRLMAGMFVKSRLIVEKQTGVFTVPTESVSTYLSNATLYVVDSENKAVRTVVSTGNYNDNETVITSGIKTGDKVVILGSVTDGTPVNVINN